MLPLVEIDHVTLKCLSLAGAYQRTAPVFGNFPQKIANFFNHFQCKVLEMKNMN